MFEHLTVCTGAQEAESIKTAEAAADVLGEPLVTADAAGAELLPPALEHLLLDETLPLDVKALWRLVMADPDFWREFQDRRQAHGLVMTGWTHVIGDAKRAPRLPPCAHRCLVASQITLLCSVWRYWC